MTMKPTSFFVLDDDLGLRPECWSEVGVLAAQLRVPLDVHRQRMARALVAAASDGRPPSEPISTSEVGVLRAELTRGHDTIVHAKIVDGYLSQVRDRRDLRGMAVMWLIALGKADLARTLCAHVPTQYPAPPEVPFPIRIPALYERQPGHEWDSYANPMPPPLGPPIIAPPSVASRMKLALRNARAMAKVTLAVELLGVLDRFGDVEALAPDDEVRLLAKAVVRDAFDALTDAAGMLFVVPDFIVVPALREAGARLDALSPTVALDRDTRAALQRVIDALSHETRST